MSFDNQWLRGNANAHPRCYSTVPRQLPRRGDELEVLRPHAGPVFALAAPARRLAVSGSGGPLLVSGSWDGSTAEFGRAGCAAPPPGQFRSKAGGGGV